MKYMLYVVGLLLLVGCSVPSQHEMTWKDYHLSRRALHVTNDRSLVVGCVELGSVTGKAQDDADAAKEKAISAAVLLGGDHLLVEDVVSDVDSRGAYLFGSGNTITVYGMAYRCGECDKCVPRPAN